MPRRTATAPLLAVALGCALALPPPSSAQPPVGPGSPTAAAELAAVEALGFLVGEWEGSGWMRMGPGEPHRFTSREVVRPALDGHALLVEGRHSTERPGAAGPQPVHVAMALLSWDEEEKVYRFQSHVVGRGAGSHVGRLENGTFVWNLEAAQREMRYTISLDDKGRWHEIGEIRLPDGWQQFFEMTLQRTGEAARTTD